MDERLKQFGQFVGDSLQEGARRAGSDARHDARSGGFAEAAAISLRQIGNRLDAFTERMSGNGPSLTKGEQEVYAALMSLRDELEAGFDKFWEGSGVDWRPPRPLVRAKLRPQPQE